MHSDRPVQSIEEWLVELRSVFVEKSPELLSFFDVYAGEALFGRRYIDQDLKRLPAGARVLEVGAGSLLLSCQLVQEGYQVTALEPIGAGFSHFDKMRQMVLTSALSTGCCPEILNLPAESLDEDACFCYAFSINVMEHVDNVEHVLVNVGRSLSHGAIYRFTCPNYLFPYEPHFNIPTLFSKRLTEKLLRSRIFNDQTIPDPSGTWRSLNWINVLQVARYIRRLPWLTVGFDRRILVSSIERVATDSGFASRRSGGVRRLLLTLVSLRIHHLFGFIPASLQPVMDCHIEKIASSESM